VETPDVEKPTRGGVSGVVDPDRVFATGSRPALLNWLAENQVLDLGTSDPDAYMTELRKLADDEPETLHGQVLDVLAQDSQISVPAEWTSPAEWVTFESPMSVDPALSDPAIPAVARLRAANDLSRRLAEKVIESLGSSRRYAATSVSFWQSDFVLRRLSGAVLAMPPEHPDNVRVASLSFPHRDALLEAFGEGLRVRDLASFQPEMLARGLEISVTEARQLMSDLLRTPGREREWDPPPSHIAMRGAMGGNA
jgi:hypothetical protein